MNLVEVRHEGLAIARIGAEPVGDAQHQPVLVAIGFPDDLVIPADRFQKRDRRPEGIRRATIGERVRQSKLYKAITASQVYNWYKLLRPS